MGTRNFVTSREKGILTRLVLKHNVFYSCGTNPNPLIWLQRSRFQLELQTSRWIFSFVQQIAIITSSANHALKRYFIPHLRDHVTPIRFFAMSDIPQIRGVYFWVFFNVFFNKIHEADLPSLWLVQKTSSIYVNNVQLSHLLNNTVFLF